ncbi:MAG: alpha/beta hydrolase, partial [Acidimicrobiia bacterium]
EGFPAFFADSGYRSVVPTWRGHYDSKPVEDLGRLSVHDYVDDCSAVIRETGAQILIGESMGGLIAMKAAEIHRDVDALVVFNPAPPFRIPTSFRVMRSQIKYLPDLLFSRPNMPAEADYKELILNNVPEPEASNFYERICPDSGHAVLEMAWGRIKINPSLVRCPVLVVIGHLDAVVPLKAHQKTAQLLSAEVLDYPEKSHHSFSEEGWEEVGKKVLAWLDDKPGKDSK